MWIVDTDAVKKMDGVWIDKFQCKLKSDVLMLSFGFVPVRFHNGMVILKDVDHFDMVKLRQAGLINHTP